MNIVDCTNRNSFPRDLYILTLVCVRRQQGIQKERTSRFGDARGQHTIKSWRIVTFPDFHVQKHPQKTNINAYVKYQPICNTWQWACSFEKIKKWILQTRRVGKMRHYKTHQNVIVVLNCSLDMGFDNNYKLWYCSKIKSAPDFQSIHILK